MNANSIEPMDTLVDAELVDYLVEQCGVSGEAALKLRAYLRNEQVPLADGAVLSGLLTVEQAEKAILWSGRRGEMEKGGVVESALRLSMGRQLAPKSALARSSRSRMILMVRAAKKSGRYELN
jgi:hypothetical protein